jgi:predicted metal-dependent phosphotriesterase family hydrolase
MNNPDEAQMKMQPSQTDAAAPQEQNLSLADIKALAKAEVADDIIISEINNTRSTFHLTALSIIDLKNAGVSEEVIAYMMNPKPKAAAC